MRPRDGRFEARGRYKYGPVIQSVELVRDQLPIWSAEVQMVLSD